MLLKQLNMTTSAPTPNSGASGSGASSRNIQEVCALEHSALAQRSIGERWADRVARTAGKVWFAVLHVFLFSAWMIVNSGMLGSALVFDAYPFQLLTLVTSLEAIFLSLFILTSQNRASAQADQRSHLDLQINLLAEAESTATMKMLQALCAHHGISFADDAEIAVLLERTEPQKLVQELQTQLPEAP
jgi:uncharacterized membrane protein